MCRKLISGFLLLCLLSSLFWSSCLATNYLMSENERIECLQLIDSLEVTLQQQKELLNNLKVTNAELLQRLTDTEKKLNDLRELLENNQILLSDLQRELQSLKVDLADFEKLLKDYERQIRWLKIERWIWGVGGIILGKVLL